MLDAFVTLLHSGLSVSRSYRDSAVSKAATREQAAVALVEGDYTYFVIIVWAKTVQAQDWTFPSMSWPWLDNYRSAG